jgi:transcriptional regulator with XRE-family HTH domain
MAKQSEAQQSESPEAQFGDRLAEVRQSKGWRQAEVGRRAGMSVNQVSRYETGDLVPALKQIRRLADAVEVSPSWLIYGVEDPFGVSGGGAERLRGLSIDQAVPRLAIAVAELDQIDRRAITQLVFHLLELQRGTEAADHLMQVTGMVAEQFASSDALEQEMDAVAERMERNGDQFDDDAN